MSSKTRYAALLIRRQGGCDQTRWRATVVDVYTGEKWHFVDRSKLLRFLWQALCADQAQPPDSSQVEGETNATEEND